MSVLRFGVLACKHEKTCKYRIPQGLSGCDLADQCPEYSEKNFFKCDICGKHCDVIIVHWSPDFKLCLKCAREVTRHLLENITRATFNTTKITDAQLQQVIESVKAQSSMRMAVNDSNQLDLNVKDLYGD